MNEKENKRIRCKRIKENILETKLECIHEKRRTQGTKNKGIQIYMNKNYETFPRNKYETIKMRK